ncbi:MULTISPECIES: Asp23/Gls24 family envelope stress response protein [Carboxydocella]|uniref:Uncharacterized conserved protein YloU, alkaline shock protein (Asp23) family n=2 Tax=Carboxydocella TaxID=178898 RepID=A0A1T4NWM0_9FIRM|nr:MULTISPECIES: Asp23/Gls24 family envelope stress response protein [Carboxydocella]AVX20143.1 putative conserved protein YloU, alkaline shock protein (Asp23) family [Carboxydocella thermautotrophica]AVX30562.1 putative conserved protein YloU, alkaline shock protein (Asp23) family [Carboxydocella thermautotrophica]SJZ83621.1 Uncharacterized conserved protein YloU, alkaline shock protein (Asp23) family [Carboxydocella sporoproducens DSM 16521]GAW28442.1 alkaline-shock protein [Carboxydocella sp
MDTSTIVEHQGDLGAVRIVPEVISIIAGLAASDVPGVAGMSGSLMGGIAEIFKKNPSKGVKAEVGEREVAIDIFLVVEYGVRIPDVAGQVQAAVKNAVESMTGMTVVEVNVHVQGVVFPQAETRNEEPQPPRVR